jgi:hypothetical protein
MTNPYELLGISQDASDMEINRGFNVVLKTKRFTHPELMAARQQLTQPARRLAADFMHPARPRAKRPRAIAWSEAAQEISLASLLPDAHDSL